MEHLKIIREKISEKANRNAMILDILENLEDKDKIKIGDLVIPISSELADRECVVIKMSDKNMLIAPVIINNTNVYSKGVDTAADEYGIVSSAIKDEAILINFKDVYSLDDYEHALQQAGLESLFSDYSRPN